MTALDKLIRTILQCPPADLEKPIRCSECKRPTMFVQEVVVVDQVCRCCGDLFPVLAVTAVCQACDHVDQSAIALAEVDPEVAASWPAPEVTVL